MAASMEIYHGDKVAEYFVTKRFTVGDPFEGDFGFAAEDGDTIMLRHCDEIPTMAHVVNLVNGCRGLIAWRAFEHNVRPIPLPAC